ncbi:MAG: amidase [Chloroflexota bacterium]
MSELHYQSAKNLARMIREKELSVTEVMQVHLDRINQTNPQVNAICTLLPEDELLAQAAAKDADLASGVTPGPLFGLPIAVKDLALTKDIRTTMGSLIYKDFVPEIDALFVERMKAAGAIIIGKTNTPEFGAGSNSFNKVFGMTRNPYDLNKVAGGSSGGGAAALAAGMIPLADGSDLGGSVRNPPSFNNVFGLRPSPGRIPRVPNLQPWGSMPVLGPMARSVEDAGLLLSVMAGYDGRDPLALKGDPNIYTQSLAADMKGKKIAWTPDLGRLPVDPEVILVLEQNLAIFEEMGCIVERAHPELMGGEDVFQTMRAASFAAGLLEDLKNHADKMKRTVIWNIEKGLPMTGLEIAAAQQKRGEHFQEMVAFMNEYDYLLLPTAQVPPFSVDIEYPLEINGEKMHTYIDWMMIVSLITNTEHPAASVPGGFTADGLPVGLQIVGKYRDELSVLHLAYAFEQATGFGNKRPELG